MKKARVISHLDMDAFFAAVEQLDHPEYRGKPVIVGADPRGGRGRGVVATASYEARKFGIHSAMPISKAYRLCPQAIFLRGRHQRYHEIFRLVLTILKDFTPIIQQISIDEAFLDLTSTIHLFENAEAMGQKIKSRIKSEVGLTASIGIAANKFIAKVASDLEKPDGLTICEPGREKEFLAPLPIRRLWGVGAKTGKKLADMGFHTIGEIAQANPDKLIKLLGSWGMHLWQLANGIDNRPVEAYGPRKSISEEITFLQDVDSPEHVEQTLLQIADRLSRVMRRKGLKGRTVTLKLRLEDFTTYTRSKTLSDFVNDSRTLRSVVVDQFRNFPRGGKRIRLVGIAVSQLNTLGGEQLTLFPKPPDLQNETLDRLLDDLKAKFGDKAIDRGTFLGNNKGAK